MANPQIENGYTKIANEILDALCGIRISGEARQCLDVIIRKTYGFNKKEDAIALSQFSLLTKMSKASICRALLKLAKMNLIIDKNVNENGKMYLFNKDFSTWKPLTKKSIVDKNVNWRLQKSKSSLTKKRNTKDNTTKETITKDNIPSAAPKRKEMSFKKEDYDFLIRKYQSLKGIQLRGNEFKPVQQTIKTMFMCGRKRDEIAACMDFFAMNVKECWQSWTIQTVAKQLPLFLAGKL